MLLTPRQEAALLTLLNGERPTHRDLLHVQAVHFELQSRANTRHQLDALSRRYKETER